MEGTDCGRRNINGSESLGASDDIASFIVVDTNQHGHPAPQSSPPKRQRTLDTKYPFADVMEVLPSSPPKRQRVDEPEPAKPVSPPYQPDAAQLAHQIDHLSIKESKTPSSMPRGAGFCPHCKDLQLDQFDGESPDVYLLVEQLFDRRRQIRISLKRLFESAKGCPTCQILTQAWSELTAKDASHKYCEYVYVAQSLVRAPLEIGCAGESVTALGEIYTLDGSPGPGIEQTSLMALANSWLEDCLYTHPDCHRNDDEDEKLECQLPTRVIDVGVEGDSPRLVETSGEVAEYVTLTSKCGFEAGDTTDMSAVSQAHEAATECAHEAGDIIDLSTVFQEAATKCSHAAGDKVFREAVRVTRQLGYRYLWINALCIIQDLPEGLIKDIYGNAVLNISIDTASESNAVRWKGLLLGKHLGELNGDHVFVRPVRRGMDHVNVPTQSGNIEDHAAQEGELGDVLDAHTLSLQEEPLSARTLYISDYEYAWECQSCCQSGCGPSRRPSNLRPFRSALAAYNLLIEEQTEALYWHLEMTTGEIKLTAGTNEAKTMAEDLGLRYVAGMWQEDLISCLMWRITGISSRPTACPSYPSWSWNSINGPMTGLWDTPRLRCRDIYSRKVQYAQVLEIDGDEGLENSSATVDTCTKSITIKAPISFMASKGMYAEEGLLTEPKCLELCDTDIVLPDVSDWSEFGRPGDNYLLLLYSSQQGNDVHFECLIVERQILMVEHPLGKQVFKRIGYCSLWRPIASENGVHEEFEETEVCLI